MKILHIGKDGNARRFSACDSPLHGKDTELVDLPRGLSADEYISAMPDCEHIIADAIAPVNAELIKGLPNLLSVHSEGVAYHLIDTDAASSNGVTVCHSAGMNAGAVAEQAVLLMLGMLKNVRVNDTAVRSGQQISAKESYMREGSLKELADCSVGLIGFGDIAKATAKLLRAFGVSEIYYYKRTPAPSEVENEYGVMYLPLNDLLGKSDIVSLHLPVTPDTQGMADEAFFAAMKEDSYFVNTARGELVNDGALCAALRSGHIAMAGLDTLSHEPVAKDHYLLTQTDIADRFLFSPHIGGITASSFRRSYAMIWEDILSVREGKIPTRAVNSPRVTAAARRFKPEDAEQVREIIVRNFLEVNVKDYGEAAVKKLADDYGTDKVLAIAQYAHTYVFEVKGKIAGVGSVASFWGKSDECIFLSIFVKPELHNKGIGRTIIDTLERDEIFINSKRCEIPASITAVDFYRKLGYDYKDGIKQLDNEDLYRLEKYRK